MSYLKEAASELLSNDGLSVFAKGLGLDELFERFLKFYCNDSIKNNYIVILINYNNDYSRFNKRLLKCGISEDRLPVLINSTTCSMKEREHYYQRNGVYSITPRLLVIDFIQKRILPTRIRGFLIYKAHIITEHSASSFCLQLYKKEYPNGFIKCFSDDILSINKKEGLNSLGQFLTSLSISNLYLWPRFHEKIKNDFEIYPLHVEQIQIPLSPKTLKIQMLLDDIIHFVLQTISKIKTNVSSTIITYTKCMKQEFPSFLSNFLGSYRMNIGNYEKKLLYELGTLHDLLFSLIYHDSIFFYKTVNDLRNLYTNDKSQIPSWMYEKNFSSLFLLAEDRVYSIPHEHTKDAQGNVLFDITIQIDPISKWNTTLSLIHEIEESKNTLCKPTEITSPTIILLSCLTEREACHYYNIINNNIESYTLYLLQRHIFYMKNIHSKQSSIQYKQSRFYENLDTYMHIHYEKNGWKYKSFDWLTPDQALIQLETNHGYLTLSKENYIIYIYPTKLERKNMFPLYDFQPTFVIMTQPNLELLRRLELYQYQYSSLSITLYFLYYGNSIEKYNYAEYVEAETKAFESVINKHKNMILTNIQNDMPLLSSQDSNKISNKTILIDMREFNSTLSFSLYASGFILVPATLSIGDYILSKDICIERKEGTDLNHSLLSGRLYNQAQAMCNYYTFPILLVMNSTLSSTTTDSQQVISQLYMLIKTFPKLRVMWCNNDNEVITLFKQLKLTHSDPDLDLAMSKGNGETINGESPKEMQAIDILLRFPGINNTNIHKIKQHIEKISDLATWTLQDCTQYMTSTDAKTLYQFLHQAFHPS